MSIERRRLLAAAAAVPLLPLAGRMPRIERERAARTRFAINVEIFWRELPLVERIERTADAGFDAIEFWPWRGKDLDAIAAKSEELGIEIAQFLGWGFERGLNDPGNHDAFVTEIRAACEAAKRLRCDKLTVIAGQSVEGMTEAEMHGHVIAGLKAAAPVVEDAGVTLILEPLNVRVDHAGHCLSDSDAALRICDAVDSPRVKLNWDVYHMQITEGDLCRRLRAGFRHVGYVQIADNPGRNEPGTGEIHWPRVFAELADLGYTAPFGLECWPKDGEAKAIERIRAAAAG